MVVEKELTSVRVGKYGLQLYDPLPNYGKGRYLKIRLSAIFFSFCSDGLNWQDLFV